MRSRTNFPPPELMVAPMNFTITCSKSTLKICSKSTLKQINGLAVFKANNKDIKIKPTESRSGTLVDNFEQTQDIN